MAKYLLKFVVVSRHPHSDGHIEDEFETTINVWPWENIDREIEKKIENLHPVGYWSDLDLISCTKL